MDGVNTFADLVTKDFHGYEVIWLGFCSGVYEPSGWFIDSYHPFVLVENF